MQINVIEYLENRAVKENPDKVAVIDGSRTLDFANLVSKSKQVAFSILGKKDCLNAPVAVFLPKSIESVIANLAITYSGNAYMNLDIKNPEARIKVILEKIQPTLIITNTELLPLIQTLVLQNASILDIQEVLKSETSDRDEGILFKRLEKVIDTDPYCIINTSGSTGTPKGVVLNHRSFIDFTEWSISTLEIHDNEIIGSLSPLYFDIYSYELCLLLAKSATLIILPEQLAMFPVKLVEYLEAQKVNFIFWVPTIMVNIANFDILSGFNMSQMQKILFAGEVFPTKHLNYWRRHVPQAMFVNLYGPIEITLDCTYFVVEKDFPNEVPIPIGYPCRNTDVLILTDENKAAMVNEKGELCVRGSSLALGYWNDPEKTARAFVQNPLNGKYSELIYRTGDVVYQDDSGVIHFAGRKDFQVKHLGYRIDLSEVEHVIVNQLASIDNACVLYNQDKKEICLFYEDSNKTPVSELRKKLTEYLPKYMIPSQFFMYEKLPRNPNGKIDRNLLKGTLSA